MQKLLSEYASRKDEIRARLNEFADVDPSEWFYELCYCFLTPQTKAVHAVGAIEELRQLNFLETGVDATPVLRTPSRYIRFHNTKAKRLANLRSSWPDIERLLISHNFASVRPFASSPFRLLAQHTRPLRNALCSQVDGVGMKEASHFLRNIGARGLAIIDRHLITNLVLFGVTPEPPSLSTPEKYQKIEEDFDTWCREVGIDMDEMDLLMWAMQTGYVLK